MMSPVAEHEVAEFEKYAPSYSELLDDPVRNRFTQDPRHFYWRKWIVIERYLRKHGTPPERLTWLDVGCGRGELLELAGRSFSRAIGCDPSGGMLPSNSSFEVYEQPSQTELPFADGSVDFLTAVCVLHHVHGRNRQLLAGEIRRVLRPGGLCCIVEHNPWNPVTQRIVKRCPVDVDAELQSAGAMGRLLRASGLRCAHLEYFLYLPEGAFQRLRKLEELFSGLPLGGQYALFAEASDHAVHSAQ